MCGSPDPTAMLISTCPCGIQSYDTFHKFPCHLVRPTWHFSMLIFSVHSSIKKFVTGAATAQIHSYWHINPAEAHSSAYNFANTCTYSRELSLLQQTIVFLYTIYACKNLQRCAKVYALKLYVFICIHTKVLDHLLYVCIQISYLCIYKDFGGTSSREPQRQSFVFHAGMFSLFITPHLQ